MNKDTMRLMGVSRRAALTAGFASVIVLLIFSSLEVYRIQGKVEARHLDIYRLFVKQDETIFRLRRDLWTSGNDVRDFFMSRRPNRAAVLRSQVRELVADSRQALEDLAGVESRRETVSALRKGIEEFWNAVLPIADSNERLSPADAYEFVQREIVPRRADLYTVMRDLAAADQQKLQANEQQFESSRHNAVRRLYIMLGLCVVLGLIVARVSLRYADNLERQTRRQYEEVVQGRRELRQLSARLLEVEEEGRRHLSRELHDEIGQTLTALRIEISHALAAVQSPAARDRLDRARSLAERTVDSVRNIALLLRPALLDDLGLVAALQWRLEDFSRRSHIQAEFSGLGVDDQLPDAVNTCLYRIVQEALHNCEKHSAASRVRVAVRQSPGTLTLEVEDDGRGFVVAEDGLPSGRSGLGILGMRERCAMAGGSLHVESTLGRGTRLVVRLPLELPVAEAAFPGAGRTGA